MPAYKIRPSADFVPPFVRAKSGAVVRLADDDAQDFAPVASPALAMQASLAARLTDQGAVVRTEAGLSPASRLVICLALASAAWAPFVALGYYFLR